MKRKNITLVQGVQLEKLGKKREWQTLNDLQWTSDRFVRHTWRIPSGFITDKYSIPRALRFLFPCIGDYPNPAVMHDYMYRYHTVKSTDGTVRPVTQAEADKELLSAMRAVGYGRFKRSLVYRSLRLFGSLAWRDSYLGEE